MWTYTNKLNFSLIYSIQKRCQHVNVYKIAEIFLILNKVDKGVKNSAENVVFWKILFQPY